LHDRDSKVPSDSAREIAFGWRYALPRSQTSSLPSVQGAGHQFEVRDFLPQRRLDGNRDNVIDFRRLARIGPATDHRGSAVPHAEEILRCQATELPGDIEIAEQGGLDQRSAELTD